MVEVKGFRFKLRVSRSLLSPTTMSGINLGDEVSNAFSILRTRCPGIQKL